MERIRMQTASRLIVLALLLLAVLASSPGTSGGDPVEPRLSDAEIGHLRHVVALARQDLDDWRGWDAENQFDMEAYRYQIAFIGYALALQQYHSVPAWREVHRDILARLIRRMIQKPVWDYWEIVSRGKQEHDPDFDGPQVGWRDPLREKNVMYSAHLAHLAALYEMLYRDFRWDEAGAFTLRWDASESYAYDLPAVVRRLHDQMATNPWGGIECEINAVFPECNQHAILAMKLYDDTHGTRYFDVRHRFRELFDHAPMVDSETHEVVAFYRVKQGDVLSNRHTRVGFPRDLLVWPMIKIGLMSFDSPAACGWTGAFMHAWEPQLVEHHYPFQKTHHVRPTAAVGQLAPGGDLAEELSVGLFAALAVEVGDVETASGLLAWADEEYDPVLEDGRLRYPRRREGKHRTHNLTGKLIGMARANRPNGLWRLHNEPWRDADFAHPFLEAVEFPQVLVRQAFWDPAAARLVVTLEPGAEPVDTTFRIVRIDATQTWELHRDGTLMAHVAGSRVTGSPDVRIVAPGTLEIATSLAAPQRFGLRRVPPRP